MKIRNGFVSNSSSSSFIVNAEDYPSVKDIAEYMIPCREWDEEDEKTLEMLRNADIDDNTPMFFQSCNYDTFIYKHKDVYLIETCNNHDWGSLEEYPDVDYSDNDDLLEKYPELDPDGDGYISMSSFFKDKEFYHIEKGFMFKDADDWDRCMNPGKHGEENVCAGEHYIIMGEKVCGTCFLTPEGKPSKYKQYIDREKKLNRVLNNDL
jgi:hypothetical protein